MNDSEKPVLVIDRDPEARSAVIDILTRAGIQSVDSEDGFEAVGRIEAGSYRAILLDVCESPSRVDRTVPMGFGVLEHLHRSQPGMLPRVVVMTSNATLFVSSPWFGRVGGLILKPVDEPALLASLRSRIDGNSGPSVSD